MEPTRPEDFLEKSRCTTSPSMRTISMPMGLGYSREGTFQQKDRPMRAKAYYSTPRPYAPWVGI